MASVPERAGWRGRRKPGVSKEKSFFLETRVGKITGHNYYLKKYSPPHPPTPKQHPATIHSSLQFAPAQHVVASSPTCSHPLDSAPSVRLCLHPLPGSGLQPPSRSRIAPLLTLPWLPCWPKPSHCSLSLLDDCGASSLVSPLLPSALFSLFSARQSEGVL